MSPWNIISKFRSRRLDQPAVAVSSLDDVPRRTEVDAPVEAFGGEGAATQPSAPENERMVVRITAHEPTLTASPGTVDEIEKSQSVAASAEASPVEPALPTSIPQDVAVSKQPAYDLRVTRKLPQKSRVQVRHAKKGVALSKPSEPDERNEYVASVFDLDDDIKRLRAALAERLEAQNGQLRDMLHRFDQQ